MSEFHMNETAREFLEDRVDWLDVRVVEPGGCIVLVLDEGYTRGPDMNDMAVWYAARLLDVLKAEGIKRTPRTMETFGRKARAAAAAEQGTGGHARGRREWTSASTA